MKFQIIFLLIAATAISFSFDVTKRNSYALSGAVPAECDSVPILNKQIVESVKTQMGKKVLRGECWDLASMALNQSGAKWDGLWGFGREVNYKSECVFPGDIIQFKGVKVEYMVNGSKYYETMKQHTAVIYEVKAKGEFILAHQNTSNTGRKVGTSPLNVKDISKGKISIYRPQN